MKGWPLAFWTVLAGFFAFIGASRGALPAWQFGCLFGFGALTWTFVEYAYHRWVLHFRPSGHRLAPWLAPRLRRVLFFLHGTHHADPNNPNLLVLPLHFSVPYFALSFAPTVIVLGWSIGLPFYSGFLLGYVVHDAMHLYLHTATPRLRFLQNLQRNHQAHHFESVQRGFGVSSLAWDRVFKTRSR